MPLVKALATRLTSMGENWMPT